MREEQKKKEFNGCRESFRCISVLVCPAGGEGIFVALNVSDGCWRNYNIRLERVEAVLFPVRASNHSFFFCDGVSGFLVGWNCNIEERSQLV